MAGDPVSALAHAFMTKDSRAFVCGTFAASYAKYSGIQDRACFDRAVMGPFDREIDVNPPLIVHLAASPDDFVAWSLIRDDALVYLYVKESYRDRGIGRSLLTRALRRAVFQTPAGLRLQTRAYGMALRFAPFLLHDVRVSKEVAA